MIARLNDLGLMPYASGILPFFNDKTLPNEEKVNQVANVGDIVGYMLTIGNFNALAAIVGKAWACPPSNHRRRHL